jgi:hypothetical protein
VQSLKPSLAANDTLADLLRVHAHEAVPALDIRDTLETEHGMLLGLELDGRDRDPEGLILVVVVFAFFLCIL